MKAGTKVRICRERTGPPSWRSRSDVNWLSAVVRLDIAFYCESCVIVKEKKKLMSGLHCRPLSSALLISRVYDEHTHAVSNNLTLSNLLIEPKYIFYFLISDLLLLLFTVLMMVQIIIDWLFICILVINGLHLGTRLLITIVRWLQHLHYNSVVNEAGRSLALNTARQL